VPAAYRQFPRRQRNLQYDASCRRVASRFMNSAPRWHRRISLRDVPTHYRDGVPEGVPSRAQPNTVTSLPPDWTLCVAQVRQSVPPNSTKLPRIRSRQKFSAKRGAAPRKCASPCSASRAGYTPRERPSSSARSLGWTGGSSRIRARTLGYFPLQFTHAGCQDGDVLAMLAALAGWPTMSTASAWSVLAGQRFFGRLNSNISPQSWLSADAQRQRARAPI